MSNASNFWIPADKLEFHQQVVVLYNWNRERQSPEGYRSQAVQESERYVLKCLDELQIADRVLALFRASLRYATRPVAACRDHTAQEAGPGGLHGCESLEADFAPSNNGQGIGIGSRGEDLACSRDTYGLFPTNHFGARKQRSAEQALLFLQERVYAAWRG
jgi:hypothetical protein